MIKRIKEIKNIGKFHACSLGAFEFKEKTVILGKNGEGKSTITAIFRSLSENDINLLKGRKTFGATAPKFVEIIEEKAGQNIPYIFKDLKWNAQHKGILIFDSRFIAENIFDGENIQDGHKTSLHKVIVGDIGKKLIQEISHTTQSIKEAEGKKKEQQNLYTKSEFSLTFDQFCKLEKDPDVDQKIVRVEKEIEFAKQIDKPKKLNVDKKDTLKLQEVLSKDFQSIHEEAGKKIKTHITHTWKNTEASQEFLKSGVDLIKDEKDSCPFCGQDLKGIAELIDAYKAFFDESYDDYKKAVFQIIKDFKNWDIITQLNTVLATLGQWHGYLQKTDEYNNLKGTLETVKSSVTAFKATFDLECDKKVTDLKTPLDFSSLQQIDDKLASLVPLLDSYNSFIDDFVTSSDANDQQELENNLKDLRIKKKRFEKPWADICDQYIQLQKSVEDLKRKREALLVELSDYSKQIFEVHQEEINRILGEIGVDFRINELKDQTDLRKSQAVYCGFELEFFGVDKVSLIGNEDTPHFRNTLSQGDRSALAFAFFMSLLKHDADLENKIVIFDDPISSFDDERRLKTVELLGDIMNMDSKVPLQRIILTHDKNFVMRLANDPIFADAKYLEITPDGETDGRKKSGFRHLDLSALFKTVHAKHLEEIKHAVEFNVTITGDPLKKCRIVLENVFQTKYYLELEQDIKNNKSVRTYTERLCELNMPGYDQARAIKFNRLFNQVQFPHHGDAVTQTAEASDGDLKSVLRTTLEVLKEI